MEQWIAFLFKNWYLIILAVTLLYGYRKKRVGSSPGGAKGEGMPSFGGAPGGASRDPRRLGDRPVDASDARSKSRQDETLKRQAEGGREPMPVSRTSAFSRNASLTPSEDPMEQDSEDVSLSVQTTPQQLMQGVVWAEILGPPRSKKPFRKK